MNYSYLDLRDQVLRELPELGSQISTLEAWWSPDTPGPYALIDEVLDVFVGHLLAAHPSPARRGLLERCFHLVEHMLASGDQAIEDLAHLGILDYRSPWWYKQAAPFLGPRAIAGLDRSDSLWREGVTSPQSNIPDTLVDPNNTAVLVRDLLRSDAPLDQRKE